MISGTLSVCLTVVVLNVHHRGRHHHMPRWIKVVFIQSLGRCLRVTSRSKKTYPKRQPSVYNISDSDVVESIEVQSMMQMEGQNNVHNTFTVKEKPRYATIERVNSEKCRRESFVESQQQENAKDWQVLARVLDRLFFITVFITMIISSSLIMLSPEYVHNPIRQK